MSDHNEYTPWEQYGETELEYYKRLYLEESATAEHLQAVVNAVRKKCESFRTAESIRGGRGNRHWVEGVRDAADMILRILDGEVKP